MEHPSDEGVSSFPRGEQHPISSHVLGLIDNDPVEQYLDARGRSVSSSLDCSCYFPSGARGFEDAQNCRWATTMCSIK